MTCLVSKHGIIGIMFSLSLRERDCLSQSAALCRAAGAHLGCWQPRGRLGKKKKQQVYRGHWLLMVTKAAIRLPGQPFCIVLIADQAFVHIVQGLKCRMAARPQTHCC